MKYKELKIVMFSHLDYFIIDENNKVVYISNKRNRDYEINEYIGKKIVANYFYEDVFKRLGTPEIDIEEKNDIKNALKSLGINEEKYPEYYI